MIKFLRGFFNEGSGHDSARKRKPTTAVLGKICFALLLAEGFGSLAARAGEETECQGFGSLADSPPLTIGRIVDTAPRTYFVLSGSDRKNCPDAVEACRAKAFLVPGDRVIVGTRRDRFVCADYIAPRGADRAGWLPAAAVTDVPATPIAPADWLGTWTREEAKVTIKPGNGAMLQIHGDATYGALDPQRVKRGAVNVGEIDAKSASTGSALAFTMGADATLPIDKGDPGDCKVWMRRLGPFLLVDDNTNCGGMNVRFKGVYTKREH